MSTIYLVDFQIRMTFLCWLQQFSIKHLLCSLYLTPKAHHELFMSHKKKLQKYNFSIITLYLYFIMPIKTLYSRELV